MSESFNSLLSTLFSTVDTDDFPVLNDPRYEVHGDKFNERCYNCGFYTSKIFNCSIDNKLARKRMDQFQDSVPLMSQVIALRREFVMNGTTQERREEILHEIIAIKAKYKELDYCKDWEPLREGQKPANPQIDA